MPKNTGEKLKKFFYAIMRTLWLQNGGFRLRDLFVIIWMYCILPGQIKKLSLLLTSKFKKYVNDAALGKELLTLSDTCSLSWAFSLLCSHANFYRGAPGNIDDVTSKFSKGCLKSPRLPWTTLIILSITTVIFFWFFSPCTHPDT